MTAMPTMNLPHHPEAMLDTREAAEALGLRYQTLCDWRCRAIGPRYFRLGRAIRYRYGDLLAFRDASAEDAAAGMDD